MSEYRQSAKDSGRSGGFAPEAGRRGLKSSGTGGPGTQPAFDESNFRFELGDTPQRVVIFDGEREIGYVEMYGDDSEFSRGTWRWQFRVEGGNSGGGYMPKRDA